MKKLPVYEACLVSINGVDIPPSKLAEFFQEMFGILVEHRAVYRYGTKQEKIEVSRRVDYILKKIEGHVKNGKAN